MIYDLKMYGGRPKKLTFLILIALFLALLIFRLAPELKTLYPIGQDTQQYLLAAKNFVRIPITTPYPLLYNILGLLYYFGVDVAIVMKVLPAVMYGILGISIFVFCHKSLNWDSSKSCICASIICFSPVTLRIGFELHNQFFSLIIFFILMAFLDKYMESARFLYRRDVMFLLGIVLLGFSHWFTAIFLLYILTCQTIIKTVLILRGKISESKVLIKLVLACVVLIASCLIGYILILYPFKPDVRGSLFHVDSKRTVSWLCQLLFYSYYVNIIFAITGIMCKQSVLYMFSFPILGILLWLVSGFSFILPVERYVWLLVFSLGIFTTNGIYKIVHWTCSTRMTTTLRIFSRLRLRIPLELGLRMFLIVVVTTLLLWHSLSMSQIILPPDFLGEAPYTFPGNILYNGILCRDMKHFDRLVRFVNNVTTSNDLIITHYTISGWIYYYTNCQVARLNDVAFSDSFIIISSDHSIEIHHVTAKDVNELITIVKKLHFSRIYFIDAYGKITKILPLERVRLIYTDGPFSVYILKSS